MDPELRTDSTNDADYMRLFRIRNLSVSLTHPADTAHDLGSADGPEA
jgi:hypothetical protein